MKNTKPRVYIIILPTDKNTLNNDISAITAKIEN